MALGCPKNVIDSERMLAQIAQSGFLITGEPEKADVVIINTCGFITPAKTEALEAIREALACKRTGGVKKVIVAGCLAERLGEELFEQAEGIDAIVGLGQRDDIVGIINKTLASKTPAAFLNHHCTAAGEPVQDDRTRLLLTPAHWAYLRISEGCDHRCSFCTIPAIRGSFRSKPADQILAEASELVDAGAVELDIIAQDTTYYGRDLKIKNALPNLLAELEKIPDLAWIRLMYTYPNEIDDRLIETIAESKKIVHYLDIPIQHINDHILKAMRRPDTKDRICSLIEKLRAGIPDIVLRTTLIIGFPGESERQFAELLEFVEWAQFDALGCFQYYPESGTAAAQMPNQVPEHTKQQRLERLMLTQQKIAFAKNARRIGSRLRCLVDSVDPGGQATGRFYGQAPDIDSICIIDGFSAKPGGFCEGTVTGAKEYDLLVRKI